MRLSISLFFRIIITVSEFSVHGKKSVIEPVIERTNVLINQGYQFILEHWKDLSAILITVIIIRIIRLLIRRRNEKKAYLKEQEQANQLQRNEALNNEILNPDRRPGDVREQKHAYRVEYSENGRASGGRGGRSSGGRASGGIFPGVKKSRGPAEGSSCVSVISTEIHAFWPEILQTAISISKSFPITISFMSNTAAAEKCLFPGKDPGLNSELPRLNCAKVTEFLSMTGFMRSDFSESELPVSPGSGNRYGHGSINRSIP